MSVYIEATKRPLAKDHTPLPDPGSTVTLHAPTPYIEKPRIDMLLSYSKEDYIKIRYWTRDEWFDVRNKKKNSSSLEPEAGPRGGTRCAQGTNVAMLYLEDTDGNPINGRVVAKI